MVANHNLFPQQNALDEAEAEMFKHLKALDDHLQSETGEELDEISKLLSWLP